jgi:lysozyme
MKTSLAGRNALIGREALKTRAYLDIKRIPTIGVGHTTAAGVPAVKMGMVITKAEALEIFDRDLATFEKAVNECCPHPITQNQFDALVSLVFNIGTPRFRKSTVARLLKTGDFTNVPRAMLMWNKPPKIIGRRQGEVRQFLTPDHLP